MPCAVHQPRTMCLGLSLLSSSCSHLNGVPKFISLTALNESVSGALKLSATGPHSRRGSASPRGSLLPCAADVSQEALQSSISLLSGGDVMGLPSPSLVLLADVRSQGDIVASGQVGTIIACVALVLPAFAPQGLRAARRFLRPRKCYRCYGTGYHICETCHGRGKEGGLVTKLELQACSGCTGRGKTRCRPCQGTGLANFWLYSPNEKSTAWGPRGE